MKLFREDINNIVQDIHNIDRLEAALLFTQLNHLRPHVYQNHEMFCTIKSTCIYTMDLT